MNTEEKHDREIMKKLCADHDIEDTKEFLKMKRLHENEGHTYHCAMRQVYGDGECECLLKECG